MNAFEHLIETTDTLLSPQGCPWDREQTMNTMRSSIIEEACELVEAIDLNDNAHIQEELGDLFFIAVFLSKLAEKEGRCNVTDVLKGIDDKLIRRHPHVFGEIKIDNSDAVVKQWGEIKQQEKGKTHRKSALDGIPKDLPSLARAQKVHKKISSAKFPDEPLFSKEASFENEEELGQTLYHLVAQAQEKGLDAEHALRKTLAHLEKAFRTFEKIN